ncbi:hypothetical protein [Caballeronia sp. M23-90]
MTDDHPVLAEWRAGFRLLRKIEHHHAFPLLTWRQVVRDAEISAFAGQGARLISAGRRSTSSGSTPTALITASMHPA